LRATGPSIVSPPQAGRARQYGEVFGGDRRVHYGPMPPTPMTPDPKRRRFNENAVYISGGGEMAESPNPYTPRKMSLPRPEVVPHPRVLVGPVPRRDAYHQQQRPVGQVSPPSKHDPSLVLPPLKTHGPSPAQRGGWAAIVMSLPVLTKVKMLNLAAPQLATPGPGSPPYEVRGAILAVEGLDVEKVMLMTEYLTEELSRKEKFLAKNFSGPAISKSSKEELASVGLEDLRGPFEAFLETIGKWHKVSRDMCKFITTKPLKRNTVVGASTETTDTFMSDSSEQVAEERNGDGGKVAEPELVSPVSPRTIIPTTAHLSIESPNRIASPDAGSLRALVPIAIVPQYQLTTVDVSAVSMAINDSYSPNDHWRWLASLWRGCVGPDITIVIRGPEEGAEGSGENWDSISTDVEVRLQSERTVVVKTGKLGQIDEKALRRVGFEVEEYLRR
jgi:HMG box factor